MRAARKVLGPLTSGRVAAISAATLMARSLWTSGERQRKKAISERCERGRKHPATAATKGPDSCCKPAKRATALRELREKVSSTGANAGYRSGIYSRASHAAGTRDLFLPESAVLDRERDLAVRDVVCLARHGDDELCRERINPCVSW